MYQFSSKITNVNNNKLIVIKSFKLWVEEINDNKRRYLVNKFRSNKTRAGTMQAYEFWYVHITNSLLNDYWSICKFFIKFWNRRYLIRFLANEVVFIAKFKFFFFGDVSCIQHICLRIHRLFAGPVEYVSKERSHLSS